MKDISTALAACFIATLIVVAIFAPYVAPFPLNSQSLANTLVPPVWEERGSWQYLLGTDRLGRDILSELIYGARISLLVGVGAVVVGLTIGVPVGMVAGYWGGIVDRAISRLIDIQMSVPVILFALLLVSITGPGKEHIIVIQGLAGWLIYARLSRGQVLTMRERPFVEAAYAIGAKPRHILFRTLLPNILPPIVAVTALEVGRNIITESSLSFLGVGVTPPDASWGRMIADGRDAIFVAWWVPTWPGLAITITAVSFAVLGDWVSDRYGAKQR